MSTITTKTQRTGVRERARLRKMAKLPEYLILLFTQQSYLWAIKTMRLKNTCLHPGRGEMLVERDVPLETFVRLRSRRVCGKGPAQTFK